MFNQGLHASSKNYSSQERKAFLRIQKAILEWAKSDPAKAEEFFNAMMEGDGKIEIQLKDRMRFVNKNGSERTLWNEGGKYKHTSNTLTINVSDPDIVEALKHEAVHAVDDIVHNMNKSNTPLDVLESRAYGHPVAGQPLTPVDVQASLNAQFPGANFQPERVTKTLGVYDFKEIWRVQ